MNDFKKQYNDAMEEYRNMPKKQVNPVFTVLFLFVFFTCLAGGIIFAQKDPRITVICFGTVFFFFGMVGIFSQKPSKDTIIMLLFPIIGLGMICVPLYFILAEKHPEKFTPASDDLIPILFGGVFMLVGLLIALSRAAFFVYREKACVETVSASCVEIKVRTTHSNGHTHVIYEPVWSYYYNGQDYLTLEKEVSSNKMPNIGDIEELRINPEKPEEIYRRDVGSLIAMILFGGVFFAAGLGVVILVLKG